MGRETTTAVQQVVEPEAGWRRRLQTWRARRASPAGRALCTVIPIGEERVRWISADAMGECSLSALALPPGAGLRLVVPGEALLLTRLAYLPAERRLLHRTAPYALEERLLTDVDELHVALGVTADGEVAAAVLSRQWLDRWLGALESETQEVASIVPEPLLLAVAEGEWALHIDAANSPAASAAEDAKQAVRNERWIARLPGERGFALEPAAARLALAAAVAAHGAPQRLLLSGVAMEAAARLQLPGPLAALLAPGRGPDFRGRTPPAVEIRVGRYVRRLPWRRWRREWRGVVGALAIAVVLQFGAAAFEHGQLRQQNLALRQEMERLYREVIPRGAIADPEVQLRRRLTDLVAAEQSRFIPLLAQAGAVLADTVDVELQAIQFSAAHRQLRLGLAAPSFDAVEEVRARMVEQGVDAELADTSRSEGIARAQLLVHGAGRQGR